MEDTEQEVLNRTENTILYHLMLFEYTITSYIESLNILPKAQFAKATKYLQTCARN